ncbi:hypothetical protein AQUCO_02000583v1 [Aquilegia coerulea]|uniref:Uncharacterized protein n=1 Tax=Aquilegia coerulea TaxID=218851 RepID=A0A2G5DID3_AQUCA|nr:hypothetical protein AQUCO_02000583v1 [Aquilegia coerulea]
MEVEYQTLDLFKPNLRTISHYKPYKVFRKEPIFEFKVIYMRISSNLSDMQMQSCMNLVFPLRDSQSCLQVNGIKIHPNERTSRPLNKHREDAFMSESVFVNTDRIKFKGKYLPFELQIQGSSVLVSGVLRRKEGDDICGVKDECMLIMEPMKNQFEVKEFNGGSVDVYFAGRCSEKHFLLNGVVELKEWKGLECIPHADDKTKSKSSKDWKANPSIGEVEHKGNIKNEELQVDDLMAREEEMIAEEGELSWFNAGVKLGIGLGVGMSLGVGVGLGLIIRTYKSSSGVFRKLI